MIEKLFDDLKAVLREGDRLIVAVLPDGYLAVDLIDMRDDTRITLGLQATIRVLKSRFERR